MYWNPPVNASEAPQAEAGANDVQPDPSFREAAIRPQAQGTRRNTHLETALAPRAGRLQGIAPGDPLWREGAEGNAVAIVREGWLIAYRECADGARQGTNLYLPGDTIGLAELGHPRRCNAVRALTSARLAIVRITELQAAMTAEPALAARVFHAVSAEHARQMERVVDLGRRSASVRLAHFIAETQTRLMQVDSQPTDPMPLPLTQEVVGELLGLSTVHVSRTFRELRERGLAYRSGERIRIPDRLALMRFADFTDRYLQPKIPV